MVYAYFCNGKLLQGAQVMARVGCKCILIVARYCFIDSYSRFFGRELPATSSSLTADPLLLFDVYLLSIKAGAKTMEPVYFCSCVARVDENKDPAPSFSVSPANVLEEACNRIRTLQDEVDNLSERLSELLATSDMSSAQEAIIRSLLM